MRVNHCKSIKVKGGLIQWQPAVLPCPFPTPQETIKEQTVAGPRGSRLEGGPSLITKRPCKDPCILENSNRSDGTVPWGSMFKSFWSLGGKSGVLGGVQLIRRLRTKQRHLIDLGTWGLDWFTGIHGSRAQLMIKSTFIMGLDSLIKSKVDFVPRDSLSPCRFERKL